ncbi:hypothetical protein LSH36_1002g02052 [Paralvinella palmiformis]|uniref:DUF3106 domain-containing protein n=1 Tax=Paralvinella palmiformis TaxID=53620 RepID=A0AAD9IWN1_9ANNE|nr:hypothetical protein LSH36_1002g02052 [Paralvinella palmiformis]
MNKSTMNLILATVCLIVAFYTVTSQPLSAQSAGRDPTDDPWYWGQYSGGCPCMHGYGPGPGWGGHRGWGMGPRGRGWGWRRGAGMRGPGWGPWWWDPSGDNARQDPLTPDNPFMPWFLYDLTPDQRTKFWDEIGDSPPPPMTSERRSRVLEALRKATVS